jgi:hypothetical protein
MSVSKMQKYSEIMSLKSCMHGMADLNEVEGVDELTDDDWSQLHEYAVQLYDRLNDLPDDETRVQFLTEGLMLHVLMDYIDQGR